MIDDSLVSLVFFIQDLTAGQRQISVDLIWCINSSFSNPSAVHGARISGLEVRVNIIEDRVSDLDARGSEESDNIANERELDRFIITGDFLRL